MQPRSFELRVSLDHKKSDVNRFVIVDLLIEFNLLSELNRFFRHILLHDMACMGIGLFVRIKLLRTTSHLFTEQTASGQITAVGQLGL